MIPTFLIEESEQFNEFIKRKNIDNLKTISKFSLANENIDLLYVFNKSNLSRFINDILTEEHCLLETKNIRYIIVENEEMFDLIYREDNILDTKIDETYDRETKTAYLFRFFRIGEHKLYTIIKNFRNYYYIRNKDGIYTTIDGYKASKCYDYWSKDIIDTITYEKDVNAFKRYAIEQTKKISLKGKFRICYFDIETNACVDAVNTDGEIISIVAQDSLTEEVKTWAIYPEQGNLVEQEQKMLEEFLVYLSNFDVITGWNILKFDLPYLINRSSKLGIDTRQMSKVNSWVSCKYKGENDLYPWFIKIIGTNIYDMMQASVRALAYLEEKLKDNKLDTVAESILGETKIHTDTPAVLFKQNRIQELIDYNIQDVLLLMKIDRKLGVTDLLVSTLDFVPGLNLEDCSYNSKVIDFYLLSKFDIIFPSVFRNVEADIEGAIVYEPTQGIHDNVAILDISGMYPNLIRTFNISPDVILREEKEDCIKIKTSKMGLVMYDSNKEGILVKLIKDFQHLREKYKKLKKENENSADYEIYKLREFATKKILSSVYGVFGFTGFRLFNNNIANSITSSGRELLGYMKKFAEDKGFEVIAGDTDSIFVKGSKENTYEDFNQLNIDMNNSLKLFVSKFTTSQRIIDENSLAIELETIFSRIIIPPAKKKYIGVVSMLKGKKLDKPKLYFKGSELNKKDVPKKFKEEIRKLVYDILLDETSETQHLIDKIKSRVSGIKKEIRDSTIKDLLIYKEINRNFDDYKVLPQHVKAAINSNKYLLTSFSRQNYKGGLLYVKSKFGVEVIFQDPNDINIGMFEIDYDKYFENFINKKISLIFGDNIFKEVNRKDTNIGKWL